MDELDPILDSVDDLSTEIQRFYVPGKGPTEGKYVLKVRPKDGYALEHVAGLKKTVDSEREARKEAEKRLKAFGDIDPDEAAQALDKLSKIGDADEANKAWRETELAKLRKEAERDKKTLSTEMQKEIEKRDQLLDARTKQLTSTLGQDRLRAAVAEAGGDPILEKVLRDNQRVIENEDGTLDVQAFDDNGEPFIVAENGTTRPGTLKEFVEKKKLDSNYDRFFDADSPSPAPAAGRNGTTRTGAPPSSGRTIRMSYAEVQANPAAYREAAQRAQETGGTVEVPDAPW